MTWQLEAARLQDCRELRTDGVPSHKAVRRCGRIHVQEASMSKSTTLSVGLDVHKNSTQAGTGGLRASLWTERLGVTASHAPHAWS